MTNSKAKDPFPKKEKRLTGSVSESLESFLRIMDEEGLDELEVSQGAFQVKLVRVPKSEYREPATMRAPQARSSVSRRSEDKIEGTPIKAPLAGIFYRAPSPQGPPFVREGDIVTPDKKLCIVEAMKVMNEITAGTSGRISKILVENGKPVQAGQTMFIIASE